MDLFGPVFLAVGNKCFFFSPPELDSLGECFVNIWVFPKIGVFPPKWMVKIMENLIKMDDLGGKPTIFGNIHIYSWYPSYI